MYQKDEINTGVLTSNQQRIQSSLVPAAKTAIQTVGQTQLAQRTNEFNTFGQSINGITSLSSTDNAGDKGGATGLVSNLTAPLISKSAGDKQNDPSIIMEIGGVEDSDGATTINEDNWNVLSAEFWTDSSDLSALSSSINSIGGGVGDTIAGLMRLITALGAVSDLATSLNVSGGAQGAMKAGMESAHGKLSELGDNLTGAGNFQEGFKGLSGVNSIKDVTNSLNTLGQGFDAITTGVMTVGNVISDPLGTAVDTFAEETGIKDAFKEVDQSLDDIGNGINDTINAVSNTIEDVIALADPALEAVAAAENLIHKASATAGILQGAVENYDHILGKSITQITGGSVLSSSEVGTVMDQINTGKPKDIADATKTIVSKNQNLHPDIISVINGVTSYGNTQQLQNNIINAARVQGIDEAIISDFEEIFVNTENNVAIFDTTVQGNTFISGNDFFSQKKNLKEYGANYETVTNPDGSPKFNTCDSYEELAQEVMVARRDITHLLIHSTTSYNNQFLTAADIHGRMIERGYDGIQFHYLIRRDGTLERGIPINRVSAVAPQVIANNTVDIIMVGGINAAVGTENPEQYLGIDSYTRVQFDTLESILVNWYRRYPGLIVEGHSDWEGSDPHFNVKKYIANRF